MSKGDQVREGDWKGWVSAIIHSYDILTDAPSMGLVKSS